VGGMDSTVKLEVFTPRSDVAGYQCFGRPCCLHLQGDVMMSYYVTTRCQNPEDKDMDVSPGSVYVPMEGPCEF